MKILGGISKVRKALYPELLIAENKQNLPFVTLSYCNSEED